jgi:hypothetical protein
VSVQLGCGVAPWNVQQYALSRENNVFYVQDTITKLKQPLIFYHFHGLAKCAVGENESSWLLACGYKLSEEFRTMLYRKYILELLKIEKEYPAFKIPLRNIHLPAEPNFFSALRRIGGAVFRDLEVLCRYRSYYGELKQQYKQDCQNVLDIALDGG